MSQSNATKPEELSTKSSGETLQASASEPISTLASNPSLPGAYTPSSPVASNPSSPVASNQSSPIASNPSSPVASNQSSPIVSNMPPEKVSSSGQISEKIKISSSVRRVVVWTMTGFFDWNPGYLLQMRGIMNVLHMVLSLTTLILLGVSCQLRPYPKGSSEGFFCKPPETFLFVVASASFFSSVLLLFCCLLSKRTDTFLFETSYEISNSILYFILFLTSSVALMVSSINWGSQREIYGNDYDLTQAAAIIGLITSILHGVSSVWFFINHRFQATSQPERPEVN